MPTKKHPVIAPPSEWTDSLVIHSGELARVRLVWRTGSSCYRPVIPITADFEALESASDSAWEALETPDTHFHWVCTPSDTDAERRAAVESVAARLWNFSRRFTRALDQRCDFKLRGYDNEDQLLFESGARYNPNRPAVADPSEGTRRAADSSPTERDPTPSSAPSSWASWGPAHREEEQHLHELKDDLIKRLIRERNLTDDRFREIARESPTLISHASAIIERAIDYQDRAVQGLVNQRTGEIESRIRAHAEEQETHREALRLDWRRHALDAVLGSVLPLGKTVFEAWANRPTNPYPQFEAIQQAIAYLGMTLDESQLGAVFNGKREAARSFIEVLEHASGLETEKDAVDALQGCETLFRTKRFRSVVTAEQQLAARFILSRVAVFRLGDFEGEV